MCMSAAGLGRQVTEDVAMTANATHAHIHAPVQDRHVCLSSTVNQNLVNFHILTVVFSVATIQNVTDVHFLH